MIFLEMLFHFEDFHSKCNPFQTSRHLKFGFCVFSQTERINDVTLSSENDEETLVVIIN